MKFLLLALVALLALSGCSVNVVEAPSRSESPVVAGVFNIHEGQPGTEPAGFTIDRAGNVTEVGKSYGEIYLVGHGDGAKISDEEVRAICRVIVDSPLRTVGVKNLDIRLSGSSEFTESFPSSGELKGVILSMESKNAEN